MDFIDFILGFFFNSVLDRKENAITDKILNNKSKKKGNKNKKTLKNKKSRQV